MLTLTSRLAFGVNAVNSPWHALLLLRGTLCKRHLREHEAVPPNPGDGRILGHEQDDLMRVRSRAVNALDMHMHMQMHLQMHIHMHTHTTAPPH